MTRARLALFGGGAIVLLGGAVLVAKLIAANATPAASDDGSLIPTAAVARGAIDLSVYGLGDLRASKSVNLSAPSVGGTLRLLRLADAGSSVKAGDVVMEFDPTEQQFNFEQAQSQLDEANQQALKMHADLDAQTAQDQLDLLTARFDVRRAELDASPDRDLVPANTFEKNQIALDEARHRLAQLQADASAREQTSRASLAIAEVACAKAKLAADRAQQGLDNLVIKAPIAGMVAIRENRDATGGYFFYGMSLPEYRTGDNVSAGRPVADVVDFSDLEIHTRVNEQERTNIAIGQAAVVQIDSVPGVPFAATIKAIAGLATGDEDTGGPLRQFDTTLTLDHPDARLRPGATASVVIRGRRVEGVLTLPRQALLQQDGKSIVYVKDGDRFDAREVKVAYRTETRVAIEGVPQGSLVALVDPEKARGAASKTSATSLPGGGR